MSVSPASWLDNVRVALKAWLLYDPAVNGEVADSGDLIYAGAPFPDAAHGIVGRKVFVDDANEPANIGEYTVAAYESANRLQLTPTWPAPDPGEYATFRLESRLAAYIRTRKGKFFWHDGEGSLPSTLTGADMPSVEMIDRGATQRQVTNVDLQVTATFHFLLAAAGKPLTELKFLYSILHDRLIRGRASRFGFDVNANGVGIGGSRPDNLQFNDLKQTNTVTVNGPIATGYFNNCEFDWLIDLRRQPDTMA